MSRFSRYDTDEERLPEGMTRVGYDADDQTYTFQDADGTLYRSAPGCEYGQLSQVGFEAPSAPTEHIKSPSWRREMGPFLNFGVLIGLWLLGLFWYLHYAASSSDSTPQVSCEGDTLPHVISRGDTCWDLANERGMSVDDITALNPQIDCESLAVGSELCVPPRPA